MSMLTRPHETFFKIGDTIAYRTAATRLHKGALVGTNAAGWLVALDPAVAGLRFAGSCEESVDHTGFAAGDRTIRVAAQGTVCYRPAPGWTPTAADLGKDLYAFSDGLVQPTTGGLANAYKVGRLVAIEAPFVRLRLTF